MSESSEVVDVLYTNWRGETAIRQIVPGQIWFGSTEWHKEPQWLLTADEPDTGKRRDYALSSIKAWGAEAILNLKILDADFRVMHMGLKLADAFPGAPETVERVRRALETTNDVPAPDRGWAD